MIDGDDDVHCSGLPTACSPRGCSASITRTPMRDRHSGWDCGACPTCWCYAVFQCVRDAHTSGLGCSFPRHRPCPATQLTGSAVIVALVQEFKTTNRHILHIDSIIFKTALALFIAFTFSPFLVLLITLLAPGRRSEAEVKEQQERLGTGPTAKKVGVIAVATSLLLWELVSPFSRDPKHPCRKLTRGGLNRSFGSSRSCRLTLHRLRLGTLHAPPNRCFSILQNQISGSRSGNVCIGTTVSRRFTSSFPCLRSSCLSCMRSRGWTDCSTR